ncbi:hypothetical protein GCM10009839_46580 [Catenulispora yoronensis]|uniref:Uncharacterized protein n=1 Tax=Catenulispora yoronensis TaxID=450799 RepID=A0ABN2UML2_9ACTN
MTELTHNSPNNHSESNIENTTDSPEKNTPAKRKQRVRGCGVPATAWFTPHPDNHAHDPATDHSSASAGTQEWAVPEIVRQFTAIGQHYSIIRIPAPSYFTNPIRKASITGHHRTTEAGIPALDSVVSHRAGLDLVALLAIDREDRGDTTGFGIRDWSPMDGRTSLETLIAGAKRMLADGGILAVRLPRPTPGSGFRDDTGAAIASARRSGLSYLQHIALIDSYIDHEGITPALPQTDLDAYWSARAQGIPIHARSHSDLLIFRKPEKDDTLA